MPVKQADEFTAIIDGAAQSFCCFGCQSVSQAIHGAGLDNFYQKIPEGDTLAPPPDLNQDLTSYDSDEVQEMYVDTLGEHRSIALMVEGIHCAACVWLIEQTLAKVEGVESTTVNLTTKRLQLKWNNAQIALSGVLTVLSKIGYAAVPFDPETADGALAKRHRGLLYRMAFAGFAMMNLMWVTIALYAGADSGEFRNWFHWIGFLIATPTLLYSGYPFYRNAIIGLKNRYLTMDLPITIGAVTTYLYSTYVTLTETTQGHVYFDTVVNFLFIILVGRYLEAISKRHALSATTRLLELQPKLATRLSNDGETRVVPIHSIKVGDLVLVKPGEKVPVDGVITQGQGAVDESMLTGESLALYKSINDRVVAGSINGEGAFTVEVEHVLRDTTLSKIVELMEEAQASKAPIQSLADRIVPWFVSITLSLAFITFLIWYPIDFEKALLAATSVLIITCPCAFGLATPMSIAVATGVGANKGILIKHSIALETLSKVTHFVFDKTGTITTGHLELTSIETDSVIKPELLLAYAASVEQYSEHSIANSIIKAAKQRKQMLYEISEFQSYPGQGVSAKADGKRILVGTQRWFSSMGVQGLGDWTNSISAKEQQGISCVLVSVDGRIVGVLGLSDQLKENATSVIHELQQNQLGVSVLSGDKQQVVDVVTANFGDIERYAEVLPKDKADTITRLQQNGLVAMVGDGVNDSPALIKSDVGIALASGTDVSVESADIILSRNNLDAVVSARKLATRTLSTIKQNIVLSILYNLIMIPIAMMGLISPIVAAITMPISSLLVIANAARIKRMFKE